MKIFIYYTSFSFLCHRQLQVYPEVSKGTLIRPVFISSDEVAIIHRLSLRPFRGWGQIRLA